MSSLKPEDLTLEQIKEQMALYQRLYHYKVKDDPEHILKRKQAMKKYYNKKKSEKEEEVIASDEPPKKNKERKYKDYKEAILLV